MEGKSKFLFKNETFVCKWQSQDALLAQHAEESRQLRQDLQRVHNLCSTAEKELKYKRDQLMELQKQNSLLDQENTRVSTTFINDQR